MNCIAPESAYPTLLTHVQRLIKCWRKVFATHLRTSPGFVYNGKTLASHPSGTVCSGVRLRSIQGDSIEHIYWHVSRPSGNLCVNLVGNKDIIAHCSPSEANARNQITAQWCCLLIGVNVMCDTSSAHVRLWIMENLWSLHWEHSQRSQSKRKQSTRHDQRTICVRKRSSQLLRRSTKETLSKAIANGWRKRKQCINRAVLLCTL